MEIPITRECTVCHQEKNLEADFRRQVNGKYGRQSACKKCVSDQLKAYRKTPEGKAKHRKYQAKHRAKPGYSEKHASYRADPRSVWKLYAAGAARRSLPFEISLAEFEQLFWQKPCHYCGDPIATAGVDRVDNSSGYMSSNCVPCCKTCNFMKLQSSAQEFIAKCKQIADRSRLRP